MNGTLIARFFSVSSGVAALKVSSKKIPKAQTKAAS
jgi:hypothetical protein